jgi:hypothetical protein
MIWKQNNQYQNSQLHKYERYNAFVDGGGFHRLRRYALEIKQTKSKGGGLKMMFAGS